MGRDNGRAPARRKVASRQTHRRILVVSGGVKTEVHYLKKINESLEAAGVRIDIDPSGRSPRGLLDRARMLRDQEAATARRSGDANNKYDSIWIVSDVDEFAAELVLVKADAAKERINLAISNPCFELWLLWHERDHQAHIETKKIQSAAKGAGVVRGKDGKELVTSALAGKYDDARRRAQTARTRHSRDGTTFPHDNPASNVDELVESIKDSVAKARPGVTLSL